MPNTNLIDRISSIVGTKPEDLPTDSIEHWLRNAVTNLSLLIPESEAYRYMRDLEVTAAGLDLTKYRYFRAHKEGKPAHNIPGYLSGSITTTGNGYYRASAGYPISYIKDSKLYIVPDGGHVEALGLGTFVNLEDVDVLNLPPQLDPAAIYYVAAHYFADLLIKASEDLDMAPSAPEIADFIFTDALSLDKSTNTITLKTYPADGDAPSLTLATDYPTLVLDDLPDQPAVIAPDLEEMGLKSYPASPSLVAMPAGAEPTVTLDENFPTVTIPDLPTAPELSMTPVAFPAAPALDSPPADEDLPTISLDATYPSLSLTALPAMPSGEGGITADDIDFITEAYPETPTLIDPPDPEDIPNLTLDETFPTFTPGSVPDIPAMIEAEAVGLSLEDYNETLTIESMPVAPTLPELTAIDSFPTLELEDWPDAPLAPSISFDPADDARSLTAPTVTAPEQGVGDIYDKADKALTDPPDYDDANTRSVEDDIEMLQGELAKLRTRLESWQLEMTDEVNRVQSLAREYDAKVTHSLEQGRLTVNVDTQMEQINSQVDMMNKSKALEADVAEYRSVLERYSVEGENLSRENNILLQEFVEKSRQIIDGKSYEIQRYRAMVEKYSTDVQSVATYNQSLIAEYNAKVEAIVRENNDILTEFRTRLESYNSEVQAKVSSGQLNVAEYSAQVQKVIQDNQNRIAAHQSFIGKYTAEVQANAMNNQTVFSAYRTTVEAVTEQNRLMAEEYRVKLESYNSQVNAAVNQSQIDISAYNAEVQKVVQDNATRLQEYSQLLSAFVARVEKVNADNQNKISHYAAQVQAVAAENNDEIRRFEALLGEYSVAVQAEVSKGQLLLGEFQTKSQTITAHNQTLIGKYQADIGLFRIAFEKVATENQNILAKYSTDVQAVATENNEILTEYRSRLESYVALVNTAAQQGQQDLGEFGALVQKVSVDNQTRISEFQSLLAKFQTLINKASEENQVILAEFAALIQQITANNTAELQEYQLGFETLLRTFMTNVETAFGSFDRSLGALNNDNSVTARKMQAYSERVAFFDSRYQNQVGIYMRSVEPAPAPPSLPREEAEL